MFASMPSPETVPSDRLAVVIPAYGLVAMTQAVVRDSQRERDVVDVIVIDNMGDYAPVEDERVVRPGQNLGWLRATNLGCALADRDGSYVGLVTLNNDTRLSPTFFAGLLSASRSTPAAGLIAPCYDDVVTVQSSYYRGAPESFPAQDGEDAVKLIDGTCYLIPTTAYRRVGPLDEAHFGRRGWGAIEDYCLRVRSLGLQVVVTRRAYLAHSRGSTANATQSNYHRYAASEFRRGMRRKWGSSWQSSFDAGTVPQDSPGDRLRDAVRHVEDRLGLSETRLGGGLLRSSRG
jgi:GT2 family glycosyltransferase